jgi:pimeloyl-ACP methyl ester carboxylesterase
MDAFRNAELWRALMHALGYPRFGAQGGDLGAAVSSVLALSYPESVVALHLNYIPGSYQPQLDGEEPSPAERRFLAGVDTWQSAHGAYSHVQRNEPQTLAPALNDSPIGLAAWIITKFREWSDCGGDLARRFTRDELLANVSLYWFTETIASSCRRYYEGSRSPLRLGAERRITVPCAIARFPVEDPFPPREWVERGYNVQRWTEMPRGGHFAAMEEPSLLADDLRAFFRPLRA